MTPLKPPWELLPLPGCPFTAANGSGCWRQRPTQMCTFTARYVQHQAVTVWGIHSTHRILVPLHSSHIFQWKPLPYSVTNHVISYQMRSTNDGGHRKCLCFTRGPKNCDDQEEDGRGKKTAQCSCPALTCEQPRSASPPRDWDEDNSLTHVWVTRNTAFPPLLQSFCSAALPKQGRRSFSAGQAIF